MAGAEIAIARHDDYLHKLKKALDPIVSSGRYDVILLDCPPSLGILIMNALNGADEVIIPMQCEYLALEGLGVMVDIVQQIADAGNARLHISGILMTMYNPSTNLSQQVVQEVIKHFGDRVFETLIPRNVRLSEAPSYGLPVNKHDPHLLEPRHIGLLQKNLLHASRLKGLNKFKHFLRMRFCLRHSFPLFYNGSLCIYNNGGTNAADAFFAV